MKAKNLLLLTLILLFAGCAALDNIVSTNERYPVITSQEVVEVKPDGTTATNKVFFTNYVDVPVLRPEVTATSTGLQLIPVPWLGFISSTLALVASTYVATRRKTIIDSLVQGIEDGRLELQQNPDLDRLVKDRLIAAQEKAGTLNAVSKVVNNITGNTVR